MATTASNLIQYVVIRKDLISVLKWPIGAVIAQACHASSAIMVLFSDDSVTKDYVTDLDRMHKCVLEVINRLYSLMLQFFAAISNDEFA